ncbi:MAG: hypothetical protein H6606_00955 [Flavobacteriales bacterium]|nr:hypothetical protein [Flavobacteriales bacterium]
MKRIQHILTCSVFLISQSLAAQTQFGTDIDGEAGGDQSGFSVSMSSDGTKLAIGAYLNDGAGTSAGHVRVYEWNGSAWVQLGSDIDGEAAFDLSGYSVSVNSDGTKLAIGAYLNDGAGVSAGHVRVYEWNGSAWVQLGSDIDGEAAGDNSGFSVSMSSDGTKLAIGAIGNDGAGANAGHVRVYEWNGSVWVQLGSDIDGEAVDDNSGYSVSMSSDGTKLAIGAIGNDGSGINAGHVRVYEWNGSAWVQLGSDIDGEAAFDNSGFSVSMSSDGTKLAIGAHLNDWSGSNAGHVRVYEWDGSAWVQLGTDIDGEAAQDNSGRSVSMSSDGTMLAIGAIGNDGNGPSAGHVRLYGWNGSAWELLGSDIDGEAADDQSGRSVSMSSDGTKLAIGANGNDGAGSNAGHVRVYNYQIPCDDILTIYFRPSVFGLNNISTTGGSDGTIQTLVRGGSAPYTYTWSGPSTASGANPGGLKAGSYFLHVLDNKGCEGNAGPWNLREPE